ncbi:hypothetical protein F909_03903 [Acinetobacter sp. ANC 3929]|uniref:hypothetical protein n=1 Tax=Acinetobacter sp. ANC 3929 TaxID=1217707 RepID=UPI0002CFE2C1|nr:hypothetical protein [Acinetobacter sp. ANC 3929]ENW78217.1 hypothetical protein F909_03903 [Acinetobacter sp. ANC 3929]
MCVNKVVDALTGGVIGSQLGGLLGSNKQPTVQVQAPPPQPIRQSAKSADASGTIDRMQQAQSSMSGGIANTLYTDPQGVSDEDLRLGKKTLLGR